MDQRIPLVRQKPFLHLVSTLDDMGVNARRRFPNYGIPEWQFGEAEDLIPLIDFIKVFGLAERVTGSMLIGRMVAERIDVADLGEFGHAIASSFTVFDAMKTACRLAQKEVNTLRIWLASNQGGYLFCRKQLYSTPEIERSLHILEQYTLELLTQIVRLGAGEAWQPPLACMSIAEQNLSVNAADRARVRLYFETPFSAIFVPNAVLSLPLRPPTPRPRNKASIQKWKDGAPELDLVSAVRELLCSIVRIGEQDSVKLETVADICGLSVRTLQRRLAANRQSYHKLLDQARYQVASDLVVEPDLLIADIAERTGYENPQHFVRAFKRWTGMTPGFYRKSVLKQR